MKIIRKNSFYKCRHSIDEYDRVGRKVSKWRRCEGTSRIVLRARGGATPALQEAASAARAPPSLSARSTFIIEWLPACVIRLANYIFEAIRTFRSGISPFYIFFIVRRMIIRPSHCIWDKFSLTFYVAYRQNVCL